MNYIKEKQIQIPTSMSEDLFKLLTLTTLPMSSDNPNKILENIDEERIRNIYEAELCYLKGEFLKVIDCFNKTKEDVVARLRICPITIAAAISMGDYFTYTQIEEYLKKYTDSYIEDKIRFMAEFSLATTAVSVLAPNMVPEWLKTGELSEVLPQARPNALYLRAKYFYSIGRFDTAIAISQSALILSHEEGKITMTEIYLRMTCAIACYALNQICEAKVWLLSAMKLALPHGFITPFVEHITCLGGLVEKCLEEEFPNYYKVIINQWEKLGKNWIVFHNQFTKDNITQILTLREFHIAVLVARHEPYAKIAKQYGISVGRLKNIMMEIREKLFISSREELEKLVL